VRTDLRRLMFTVWVASVVGTGLSAPRAAASSPAPKASTVKAESIEGSVRTVGSAINARTVLAASGSGAADQALCRDAVARRVAKLGGMVVRATGNWNGSDGKTRCFAAASFVVVRNSSGREPLVGILRKDGAGWHVTSDSGVRSDLTSVPSGLAKLDGRKVIVDAKPMDMPAAGAAGGLTMGAAPGSLPAGMAGKSGSSRVVTYSEFP